MTNRVTFWSRILITRHCQTLIPTQGRTQRVHQRKGRRLDRNGIAYIVYRCYTLFPMNRTMSGRFMASFTLSNTHQTMSTLLRHAAYSCLSGNSKIARYSVEEACLLTEITRATQSISSRLTLAHSLH